MAEEVEIVGVDGGAASEATLRRLLDAIRSANAGGETRNNVQGNYNRALRDGVRVTSNFNDSVDGATTSVEALGNAVPRFVKFIALLVEAGAALVTATAGFSKELMMGGREIGDFVKYVPVLGEQLQDFAGIFTAYTNNLREASEMGASFGNDIMGMSMAAARAQMPLEEFSSLITNNSETLRQLGTTTTNGALRLSQLTKGVRLGTESLMGLGFTTEQLNEGTASFIRIQARSGRLQQMSDTELINGTQSYLKEMDLLSKITGKSRKELQNDMEKTASEANVLVMMQKMGHEEKQRFLSNMTMVDTLLGEDMGNAFKDLADGVAQTDLGKKLESLNSPLGDLARQSAAGNITTAEFNEKLKTVGPELLQFATSMGAAGTSALMTQAGFAEMMASLSTTVVNSQRLADASDAAAEQMSGDKLSEKLLGFNQEIDTARSNITEAWLDTKIFARTKDAILLTVTGLTTFNNYLSGKSANGLKDFDNGLQKFLDMDMFGLLTKDKPATVTSNPQLTERGGRPQPGVVANSPPRIPNPSVVSAPDTTEDTVDTDNTAPGNTGQQEAMSTQNTSPTSNKPVNTAKADEQISATKENTQIMRDLVTEAKTTNRLLGKGQRIA
jgi:hypothetical protein